MIFMADDSREHLELKAQASRYAAQHEFDALVERLQTIRAQLV